MIINSKRRPRFHANLFRTTSFSVFSVCYTHEYTHTHTHTSTQQKLESSAHLVPLALNARSGELDFALSLDQRNPSSGLPFTFHQSEFLISKSDNNFALCMPAIVNEQRIRSVRRRSADGRPRGMPMDTLANSHWCGEFEYSERGTDVRFFQFLIFTNIPVILFIVWNFSQIQSNAVAISQSFFLLFLAIRWTEEQKKGQQTIFKLLCADSRRRVVRESV